MINKKNIIKNPTEIDKIIEEDPNIDVEKIRKYFDNVINERHFLQKY
jgi:hypothetical protein